MNIYKKEQQSIKEMERQLYVNRMKLQEEIDRKKRMDDKEKQRNEQANYSRILQIQKQSKLDKLNSEKQADKMFSEAEKLKILKEEEQRNRFFEKLNRIQENNDIKQKKLQEYMEQDPKELRSKIDEANYLKNMELAEHKGKIKEIEQKSQKEKSQMNNYQSLSLQLQEKQIQKQNMKMQENAIAHYYMQEASRYQQEVESEKAKKKMQKEEYYKALSDQINENKKKKQYSVLMTEHERRVNDRDIKAYEQQDTKNLYAKVVGFSGDNRHENYIDKSLIVGSNGNSPTITSTKAMDVMEGRGGQNSNLARMGQMSLNRSANILTDVEEPPRPIGENGYSHLKLQKVKENMEKPDALKYRANTINRSYGFVQNLNKTIPTEKMATINNEGNPYEYNYIAPGNY